MVDLIYYLTNLLFFDILLLYYYVNVRVSIVFLLFLRYIAFCRYFFIMLSICYFIYNCFWIILWRSLWGVSNFISDFISNQITRCLCCFWITLFEAILSASVRDCLTWPRSFFRYSLLRFFIDLFANSFAHIFAQIFWFN